MTYNTTEMTERVQAKKMKAFQDPAASSTQEGVVKMETTARSPTHQNHARRGLYVETRSASTTITNSTNSLF